MTYSVVLIACMVPFAAGLLLGTNRDITTLVNEVVMVYGSKPNVQQCQRICVDLYITRVIDLSCTFTCPRIQKFVDERMHYPSAIPSAAPTPGPSGPTAPQTSTVIPRH